MTRYYAKTLTALYAAIMVFVLLSVVRPLSANANEAKASEIVIGFWKEDGNSRGNALELRKDALIRKGRTTEIAIDDRDGRAVIRLAGLDEAIVVIKVIDNDHIEVTEIGRKKSARFTRISQEEFEKLS